MRPFLVPVCAIALAVSAALPARAAESPAPPMRTISLSTTSHVDYVPDLAVLTFGARSDAPTAAEAANRTNAIGNKIVSGVEKLGILAKDVQTSQYDISFEEAVPPTYAPARGGRARVLTQPGRAAYYEVTTSFTVKAPVARAGEAIDAAVRAGANASYGVGFASSELDAYYERALANAMQSARARATALAAAAGVTLGALQTVTTSGAPSSEPPPAPAADTASFAKAAPLPAIAAGTQSVDASVDVVYAIQ